MLTALLTTVVLCVFATPAQAALTRSQMFAKAAGMAAFSCFAHDCSGRKILSVSGPDNRKLMTYKFRLFNVHGIRGRTYSRCDRNIQVSPQGTVSYTTYYNCV